MARDNSFLRFTKNNFASAKNADNPNIVTIPYDGFIVLHPNETICQISNSATNISFVGGITVDLVDSCENVVRNITSNFYYTNFTDKFGIEQIAFEFGNLNQDFHNKILYVRITDTTNLNKWYSNNLLITYYQLKKTTRFDYWSNSELNGIAYDIAPFKQSVRLSGCFYHTQVNENNISQYTKYSGKQLNYRSITTYLRKYLIDSVDFYTNDRLCSLFEHPFIYIDTERVQISNYEVGERLGDSNIMSGNSFLANPQDEALVYQYQLYQSFNDISTFVANNSFYTLINFNTALSSGLYINFNNVPFITPTFEYKLYENGVLVLTGTGTTTSLNKLYLDDLQSYTFANGEYSITIMPNLVYNGVEFWSGFAFDEWKFKILNGEFDNTEFSTTEFLTN